MTWLRNARATWFRGAPATWFRTVPADVHTLVGPYVLDAASKTERRQLEQHLEACASCRDEVAELRDVTAMFPALTGTPPPSALRAAVLEQAATTPQRGSTRRPRTTFPPRLAWVLAAMLLVFVLAAGVMVAVVRTSEPETVDDTAQVLQASDVQSRSVPITGGGTLTVVSSQKELKSLAIVSDVEQAPSGRTYQMWQLGSGARSVATMGDDGSVLVQLQPDTTGIGLTVEPAGGSRQPSSAPVVIAPI